MTRWIFLAVTIGGCAGTAASRVMPPAVSSVTAATDCARPGTPAGGFGLTPPREAGEYRVIQTKQFEKSELGSMKRYSARDYFWIDVFFYPAPHGCSLAMADSLVSAQARGFFETMLLYKQRGRFSEVQIAGAKTLKPAERDEWLAGRYVSVAVQTAKGEELEEFYLYYLDGMYLKFRVTIKRDPALIERVADFPTWYIPLLMTTRVPDKK